jgi:hypothetical protein
MNLTRQILLVCFIMVIELPFRNLYSQAVQPKPDHQSPSEAFSQGNYEKAYNEFHELLLTYTKDPLYKYYCGVCLVKLGRNPGEAIILLQEALQGDGKMKPVPSDGLFYLGRAQHMSGQFTEAAKTYNLYIDKVGKKAAKEMGVPGFIDQCLKNEGQVTASKPVPVETKKSEKKDSNMAVSYPLIKETVTKSTKKETVTKEALPVNYDIIMGEAIEFQFKADSVSSLVRDEKREADKFSGSEKSSLQAKILENEKIAASFQTIATQKFHEAHLIMNPAQDSGAFKSESNKVSENKVAKDTTRKTDSGIAKAAEIKPDAGIPSAKSQLEVFTLFDIAAKQETDTDAKIIIDPEVPEGLIYRIQVAVFRNLIGPSYFKGINPVYGFKIEGTDKTIYYAGMFRKASDAGKALGSVKNKGFKDAFVVAFSGNKRVSSDRAASLEKEWGMKPFYSIEKLLPETKTDTITPTLSFRAEVTSSSKPLNLDVVEGMKKLAGNRGMDIQLLEDGKIAYLIGKFITFETAAEYVDLLKRNGYRDAQVSAWLGKKQIPVQTAKQLFDTLK